MLVNTGNINNVSYSSGGSAAGSSNVINSRTAAATPLLAETNSRQTNLTLSTATASANSASNPPQETTERNAESVQVSSSIGRAASAGQLTREQALEIYRNIARFL